MVHSEVSAPAWHRVDINPHPCSRSHLLLNLCPHCLPAAAVAGLQDPGNLESDLQVGANAGYALLWVLLWSTVLVSTGGTWNPVTGGRGV